MRMRIVVSRRHVGAVTILMLLLLQSVHVLLLLLWWLCWFECRYVVACDGGVCQEGVGGGGGGHGDGEDNC